MVSGCHEEALSFYRRMVTEAGLVLSLCSAWEIGLRNVGRISAHELLLDGRVRAALIIPWSATFLLRLVLKRSFFPRIRISCMVDHV